MGHLKICALVCAFSSLSPTVAQEPDYFDTNELAWEAPLLGTFRQGNGAFMAPGDVAVVALTSDCSLRAFDPYGDGMPMWQYSSSGAGSSCSGGVSFGASDDGTMLAFMEDDGANTKVVVLDATTGDVVTESSSLPGSAAGSPQFSADSRFLGCTHNVNGNTGHFSLFDAATDAAVVDPVFTESASEGELFAPLGVTEPRGQPIFADQDVTNPFPIFIWGRDTVGTTVGVGSLWGFQLPGEYDTMGAGNETFIVFADGETWQTSERPTFTTGDASNMYLSTTRNTHRGWTGGRLFDAPFTVRYSELERGDPAFISGRASYVLSDPTAATPTAYGPAATAQFIASSFVEGELLQVLDVDALILGRAAVSPEAERIYTATAAGTLYTVLAEDFSELSAEGSIGGTALATVNGDLAISSDGSRVFVPSSPLGATGSLIAVQLANSTFTRPPTMAPVPGATEMPVAGETPTVSPPATTPVPPIGMPTPTMAPPTTSGAMEFLSVLFGIATTVTTLALI